MESEDIIFLDQSNEQDELLEAVFWQWQSGPNPDPWAEEDASKWSWQDYSHDECLIIEQAFLSKKEIAQLTDYEVDLKRMIQVNKKFRNRIRRVRRQEHSRFQEEMSKPVAFIKDQKTMNAAFGTVQHFLDYIMKRTSESSKTYEILKALALNSQKHGFQDVLDKVIHCIEKGAETREKIIKTRGLQKADFLKEAKEIIQKLTMNSSTLEQFLKTILRVYTMNTFVYSWLNELLRSENWEEINVLTPFLVCLVYTFNRPEFIIKYKKPQGFLNSLFASIGRQKLYLYRGAALTRRHLELYDKKKIEYFSWNGVTSTSRDENVALSFIRSSLKKARRLNEQKVGVLFRIEVDFNSDEDCEGMIDAFENSLSEYLNEKEVILAPGTVFQLKKTQLNEDDVNEITLRVKRKFDKTNEGITLLGSLQDKAIFKDRAIIDGLPSQQSFRLLDLLEGNESIQKLEIRNSLIDEHILEKIESLRATTNVKKEDIKLRNNVVDVCSLDVLVYYFTAYSLSEIFTFNKIRLKESNPKIDLKGEGFEGKTVVFKEEVLVKCKRNNQLKELSEKILSAKKIEILDLKLPNCGWTYIFLQTIKRMENLKSLTLRINEKHFMEMKDLEMICRTIGSSVTLSRLGLQFSLLDAELELLKETLKSIGWIDYLSLDLRFCSTTSNEGLKYICSGLPYLQRLSMNFPRCSKISDEGLDHLKDIIKSQMSLQYLSLNFEECNSISDDGLNHLSSCLLSHSSLESLSLNFKRCRHISDDGLNYLSSTILLLPYLQHLSLNFKGCEKILGKGIEHLSNALLPLSSLRHLTLNFAHCLNISNGGLFHLMNGVLPLSSLQHLSLSFDRNSRYVWESSISDEGLIFLKSCLFPLSSLKHLSLSFSECLKISDEGFRHLRDGLLSLSSLQNLDMNFSRCRQTLSEGLNYVGDIVRSLKLLQHLSLNFTRWRSISDKNFNNLIDSIVSLSSLQHLSLKFKSCLELSNECLQTLGSGLFSLSSLQYLSLDFGFCPRISDQGLSHIKSVLISLSSLQHLSLNFAKQSFKKSRISDEGLNHIKNGLLSLSSLSHLHLSFQGFNEISDKGLSHLKSGFSSLSFLHDLYLNFQQCVQISDEGLNNLKSGFIQLPSLHHLFLDIHGCDRISPFKRENLCKELKFIPNLEII